MFQALSLKLTVESQTFYTIFARRCQGRDVAPSLNAHQNDKNQELEAFKESIRPAKVGDRLAKWFTTNDSVFILLVTKYLVRYRWSLRSRVNERDIKERASLNISDANGIDVAEKMNASFQAEISKLYFISL